jgi:hypothetical protein
MRVEDTGKFVGRYFQVLACASFVVAIVERWQSDRMVFDLTWVVFLALGHFLIRHRNGARLVTLALCGLVLIGAICAVAYGSVAGEYASLSIGAFKLEEPTFQQLLAFASVLSVAAAIPLLLLLTPQAKREFVAGNGGHE